jgi:lipoprotein-anchoring transpeptidase ErfK/SrfK
MIGGSKWDGTYYNLPNVPYVIYFYNARYPKGTGYALHGTYWHTNFGNPMSHGCINLRTSDMAILYYWIDTLRFDAKGNGMGTMIIIQGVTPRS